MSKKLLVRRAAVLGAGVMGAQIAAHLTNAGVDTVLFDLAAKEGPADGVVLKAIANLGKLSPAPLASKALAEAISHELLTDFPVAEVGVRVRKPKVELGGPLDYAGVEIWRRRSS